MNLELFSSGLWLASISLPMTSLTYIPKEEKQATVLSITGGAVQFGYGFSDMFGVLTGYEAHYSLASKNVFLHGLTFTARPYLSGGMTLSRMPDLYQSLETPLFSTYINLSVAYRFFDLTIANSGSNRQVDKPEFLSFSKSGQFSALGVGVGADYSLTHAFKLNVEAEVYRSLTVSTPLQFLQFVGRIGVIYQL